MITSTYDYHFGFLLETLRVVCLRILKNGKRITKILKRQIFEKNDAFKKKNILIIHVYECFKIEFIYNV